MLCFARYLYVNLLRMHALWFAGNLYVNLLGMHALQRLPEVPGDRQTRKFGSGVCKNAHFQNQPSRTFSEVPREFRGPPRSCQSSSRASGSLWRGPASLILEIGVRTNARAKFLHLTLPGTSGSLWRACTPRKFLHIYIYVN